MQHNATHAVFYILLLLGCTNCARWTMPKDDMLTEHLHSFESIIKLFPTSAEIINQNTERYIEEAKHHIENIISLPDNQRTKYNTLYAFDKITTTSNIAIWARIAYLTSQTNTNADIREAAQQSYVTINQFFIQEINNNEALYKAIITLPQYDHSLSEKEQYVLQEIINEFKLSGFHLPLEKRTELVAIEERLAQLSTTFSANIAHDDSHIIATKDELAGIADSFIESLPVTDDGKYRLNTDYPTRTAVMETCHVEATRKRWFAAFMNRAYPANESVLNEIIKLRDKKARLLGYKSFAAVDLHDQMAKTVDRVTEFLNDIDALGQKKLAQEFSDLKKVIDASLVDEQGKIAIWNCAYAFAQYKRRAFNLDEDLLKEYFPLDHTLQQLLSIYESFMGVTFHEEHNIPAWHPDVRMLKVTESTTGKLYGYLFLDLHPRANKFSHAAYFPIVSGITTSSGELETPTVGAVIANFPNKTADSPALLHRSDVRTFFHEFGHALHALLGAQPFGSVSGTNVKRDFVEMPSQMLEEWLFEPSILKKVSKHYKSGAPLPGDVIDTIQAIKNISSGYFITTQIAYARIALAFFDSGEEKDLFAITNDILEHSNPFITAEKNHFYSNFGHLTGYAAKYYGYVWSKVFALDLFAAIKQHGLEDPTIGERYVETVLKPAGSCDPDKIIEDFLGRAPNSVAFFKDLGLS